ncbi:hypothetical protein [Fodinicola feengrottensis]|nr:hypothetical protein [Fodinicola feengrottensis]
MAGPSGASIPATPLKVHEWTVVMSPRSTAAAGLNGCVGEYQMSS